MSSNGREMRGRSRSIRIASTATHASLLLVAGAFTNEGVKEMEDLEEIDYDASDYYFD